MGVSWKRYQSIFFKEINYFAEAKYHHEFVSYKINKKSQLHLQPPSEISRIEMIHIYFCLENLSLKRKKHKQPLSCLEESNPKNWSFSKCLKKY